MTKSSSPVLSILLLSIAACAIPTASLLAEIAVHAVLIEAIVISICPLPVFIREP